MTSKKLVEKTATLFSSFAIVLAGFANTAKADSTIRPFAEYEPVRYMVMSAAFDHQTLEIKKQILRELPPEVQPIIFTKGKYDRDWQVFQQELGEAATKKMIYINISVAGEGFWPRDSMPYPIVKNGSLELVDAPYYPGFEPDEVVAKTIGVKKMSKHKYELEHGNFVANRLGTCVVVQETFAARAPDSIFISAYGCKEVIRLPFIVGIGHADEVVKFMADDVVLTNHPDFESIFKAKGFKVLRLPEAKLPEALVKRGVFPQRSYVNSLLVNGTVFVPVFGSDKDADEEAIRVYQSLGLKVVPVQSAYVSDYGGGALHCLSMTYPAPF